MGKNLRVERAKLNITQEELSRMSGVNRPTISLIENDKMRDLKLNTVIKLAKALNITVSELIGQ